MIVAEFIPSVRQGTVYGFRSAPSGRLIHLVKPHKLRPELEGRRVRPLCGRGGTVVRVLGERPARGICPDCRAIANVEAGLR
jgi:hypothetical protein